MTSGYPDYTLPIVVIGTVTVTGTVAISGTVTVTGAVTVSGTVSISGTVTVTGSVTVSGTVSISGTVTVTGSVTVSGTVSISGSVTVTGSVTVSGAVTITTVAADNIIIDKLTVGAYTERQTTLQNYGTLSGWGYAPGNYRDGKFFPRSCRGFITAVSAYCQDFGGAGGTIRVGFSPHPDLAPIFSADITVPAGGGGAWRQANVNRMWNYDSLFLAIQTLTGTIYHGLDADAPYDYYVSTDSGATWTTGAYRLYFRVFYVGLTCGDVPVSGTINTIEMPNLSAEENSGGTVTVPAGTEVTLATHIGSGIHLHTLFYGERADYIYLRIYCDGERVLNVNGDLLNAGFGASTPKVSLLAYTAGAVFRAWVTAEYPFKRMLKIKAYNSHPTTNLSAEVVNSVVGKIF